MFRHALQVCIATAGEERESSTQRIECKDWAQVSKLIAKEELLVYASNE
jgi:hypothetical protein